MLAVLSVYDDMPVRFRWESRGHLKRWRQVRPAPQRGGSHEPVAFVRAPRLRGRGIQALKPRGGRALCFLRPGGS